MSGWVAILIVFFLLGMLVGWTCGIAATLRDVDRKQRLAYRRLKELSKP